jgi:hypothetical protein
VIAKEKDVEYSKKIMNIDTLKKGGMFQKVQRRYLQQDWSIKFRSLFSMGWPGSWNNFFNKPYFFTLLWAWIELDGSDFNHFMYIFYSIGTRQ